LLSCFILKAIVFILKAIVLFERGREGVRERGRYRAEKFQVVKIVQIVPLNMYRIVFFV